MTGFDIAVLVIVGLGAVTGFMRGFVHECLVLAAWIVAVLAIHTLLGQVTTLLLPYIHSPSGAAVLAFAILLIVPLAGIKLIAGWIGSATRNSLIGPIDRVLGFGFGAVKGTLIVVLAFSVVALAYDVAWGKARRPAWITGSRTYPFINACSDKLVTAINERRHESADGSSSDGSSAAAADTAASTPQPRHRRKHGHSE